MKNLLIVSVLLATVGLCGCSPKRHKRNVHVVHLKDGRYAYKEKYKHHRPGATQEGNDWVVWYWLMHNDGGTYNYYYNSKPSTGSSFSPPARQIWVEAGGSTSGRVGTVFTTIKPSPTPEELQSPLEELTESVITDQYGNPEVDADGNLVDPDSIAMEPDTTTVADTDAGGDSGSGSGDGGSGDSGGGDSGGDSGGGGD